MKSDVRSLSVALLCALVFASSCVRAPRPEQATGDGAPPTALVAAPADDPAGSDATIGEDDLPTLDGVDTSGLTEREHRLWWSAVADLDAPCPDQAVSIVRCIETDRPCSACTGAASMLLTMVKAGASAAQLTAAHALRFGPMVHEVDEGDSPAKGPADAPVHIVVWHDFECPACRDAMPFLDRAVESYGGQVRVVHKYYPLKNHLHADQAARAAIAADRQGRYWEMETTLFSRQSALEISDLERYAGELGLDLAKFRADMGSERAAEVIARDREDADRLGLAGTPFILINGRHFDLSYFRPSADLDAWIETELEMLQIVTPSGESAEGGGASVTSRPSTDTSSN